MKREYNSKIISQAKELPQKFIRYDYEKVNINCSSFSVGEESNKLKDSRL